MYDSKEATLEHINTVQAVIFIVVRELEKRAEAHDVSKLSNQEKPVFDEYTPKLKNSTYGSDEYKGFLAAIFAFPFKETPSWSLTFCSGSTISSNLPFSFSAPAPVE